MYKIFSEYKRKSIVLERTILVYLEQYAHPPPVDISILNNKIVNLKNL